MKKERKRYSQLLETETIGEGNHFYFIDLCLAVNDSQYLRLVRSDRVIDEQGKVTYLREVVHIFEENFGPLFYALDAVFGRYRARGEDRRSPAISAP